MCPTGVKREPPTRTEAPIPTSSISRGRWTTISPIEHLTVALLVIALLGPVVLPEGLSAQGQAARGVVTGLALTSDNPGELTISWTLPDPEPSDYRIEWTEQSLGFLSYTRPNEAGRGNEYPEGETTSITLTGLTKGATHKVRMRARYESSRNGGPWSGPRTAVLTARVKDDPPPAPTGLTASGVSHDGVTITWTAPTRGNVTGYRVLRGPDEQSLTALVEDTGDTGTEYTDATVAEQTAYVYAVAAVGPDGEGARSTVVTVTTPPPLPGAPTGLAAVASETQVTLSWDDPQNATITGYRVWRGTDSQSLAAIVDDTGETTTGYVDATVVAETGYVYAVSAINPAGTGPRSSPVSATAAPGAVPGLALSSDSPGELTISWTLPDPEPSDYHVAWAEQSLDFLSADLADETGRGNQYPAGSSTSITLTGLAKGGTHKVRAQARYQSGGEDDGPWNGPWSAVLTARVKDDPPPAPTGLTASGVSHGSVTITWTAPTRGNVTGYRVLRGPDEQSLTALVEDTGDTGTEYTDATVTEQTTYAYAVTPLGPDGEGARSAAVTVTTQPPLPGAPTGLAAAATANQVTLSWDDPQNATITGYRIRRGPDSQNLATIAADTGETTTGYVDATVAAGTTYVYTVSAVNPAGTGPPSAPVSAGSAPGAIPGLALSSANPGELTISWTLPHPEPSDYRIVWADNSRPFLAHHRANQADRGNEYPDGSSTSITLSGLAKGATHKMRMRARYDSSGNSGAWSGPWTEIVTFRVKDDPPPAPTGLAVSGASHDGVTITWTAPARGKVTGYRVLRGSDEQSLTALVEDTGDTATEYTDATVTEQTTYAYAVTPLGPDGDGERSAAVTVTTPPPPPAAPTGLAAAVAANRVTLSWDDPRNATITGYEIRRGPDQDNLAAIAADTGETATSYVDSGLTAGTTYVYAVSAINPAGTGPPSTPVSATALTGGAVPGLALSSDSPGELTVSWKAPYPEPSGYHISWADHSLDFLSADLADEAGRGNEQPDSSSTSTTLSGLTKGATHKVRARARYDTGGDADGPWNGPWTETVTARVKDDPPPAPTGLAVSGTSHNRVTLTWTAPTRGNVSGYRVLRGPDSQSLATRVEDTGDTGTEYTDAAVTGQTTYVYAVTPLGPDGDGAQSAAVTVTTPPRLPAAPTGLAAVATADRVTLSWADPQDDTVTGYKIRRGPDEQNLATIAADTGEATTGYVDAAVAADTGYVYVVSAINPAGTGPPSARVFAGTGEGAIPGLALSSDSPGELTMTWTLPDPAPSDYRISWAEQGWGFLGYNLTNQAERGNEYPDGRITSITLTGLAKGATHKVRTRARYQGTGNRGPWSGPWTAVITARVNDDPAAAPTGLAVSGVSDDGVTITWTAPARGVVTGYRILRGPDAASMTVIEADTGNTATTYTDHTVAAGIAYVYAVVALGPDGDGTRSAALELPTRPAKPTGLTALAGTSGIMLEWDDPANPSITGYEILRAPAGGHPVTIVADTGTPDHRHLDGTTESGALYSYAVKAINPRGTSERSELFILRAPDQPAPADAEQVVRGDPLEIARRQGAQDAPATPTGVTSTGGTDRITVTWDDPADDTVTGYAVQRYNRYGDHLGAATLLTADTGEPVTTYVDHLGTETPPASNTATTATRNVGYRRTETLAMATIGDHAALYVASPGTKALPVATTTDPATGGTETPVEEQAVDYQYRVYALNEQGASKGSRWSNRAAPRAPQDGAPDRPTQLRAFGADRTGDPLVAQPTGQQHHRLPHPPGLRRHQGRGAHGGRERHRQGGRGVHHHRPRRRPPHLLGRGNLGRGGGPEGVQRRLLRGPRVGADQGQAGRGHRLRGPLQLRGAAAGDRRQNAFGGENTAVDDTLTLTVTVRNVNEAGSVSISGNPQTGQTLTATLSDPDGTVSGERWQWASAASAAGPFTNIGSAQAASYTVASGDNGRYLRATATYTDPFGSGETTASATTAPVGTSNSSNRRSGSGPLDAQGGSRTPPPATSARRHRQRPRRRPPHLFGVGRPPGRTRRTHLECVQRRLLGGRHVGPGQRTGRTGTSTYEDRTSYTVLLQVTDGLNAQGGADTTADDTLALTVIVRNVNEAGSVSISGDPRCRRMTAEGVGVRSRRRACRT